MGVMLRLSVVFCQTLDGITSKVSGPPRKRGTEYNNQLTRESGVSKGAEMK